VLTCRLCQESKNTQLRVKHVGINLKFSSCLVERGHLFTTVNCMVRHEGREACSKF